MDLTDYTLIDVSTGTVLTPHTCVLMPSDTLSDSEWEDFDSASDSEIIEIGREKGTPLSETMSFSAKSENLLQSIADALWGEDADKEWNADTIDAIATAIMNERVDLYNERVG